MTWRDDETGHVTHEEARAIADRFIDGAFDNDAREHPRFSIPARPGYDDDIRLQAYIDQQEARPTAPPAVPVGAPVARGLGNSAVSIEKIVPGADGHVAVDCLLPTGLKLRVTIEPDGGVCASHSEGDKVVYREASVPVGAEGAATEMERGIEIAREQAVRALKERDEAVETRERLANDLVKVMARTAAQPPEASPPVEQPPAPPGFRVVGRSGPGVPHVGWMWVDYARFKGGRPTGGPNPWRMDDTNATPIPEWSEMWDAGCYDILEPLTPPAPTGFMVAPGYVVSGGHVPTPLPPAGTVSTGAQLQVTETVSEPLTPPAAPACPSGCGKILRTEGGNSWDFATAACRDAGRCLNPSSPPAAQVAVTGSETPGCICPFPRMSCPETCSHGCIRCVSARVILSTSSPKPAPPASTEAKGAKPGNGNPGAGGAGSGEQPSTEKATPLAGRMRATWFEGRSVAGVPLREMADEVATLERELAEACAKLEACHCDDWFCGCNVRNSKLHSHCRSCGAKRPAPTREG